MGLPIESESVMMADVVQLPDGRYRMYYRWANMQQGTGIKSAISVDDELDGGKRIPVTRSK